jgi:hypothetical protein
MNIQEILYNSGDAYLPKKIKDILRTNLIGTSEKTFYVSGWSIIHLINGIIIGYIYLYYLNGDSRFYTYRLVIIHTMWEFWQMLIGMTKPYNLTGPNNLFDTILDTIFFMIGAYIIRKY